MSRIPLTVRASIEPAFYSLPQTYSSSWSFSLPFTAFIASTSTVITRSRELDLLFGISMSQVAPTETTWIGARTFLDLTRLTLYSEGFTRTSGRKLCSVCQVVPASSRDVQKDGVDMIGHRYCTFQCGLRILQKSMQKQANDNIALSSFSVHTFPLRWDLTRSLYIFAMPIVRSPYWLLENQLLKTYFLAFAWNMISSSPEIVNFLPGVLVTLLRYSAPWRLFLGRLPCTIFLSNQLSFISRFFIILKNYLHQQCFLCTRESHLF